MSKSTHQFEIRGVDKSGKAFNSIKNRAATTAGQIRSMVGGALSALGAYMGLRSIKGGIDELGRLNDIAMRTNTNVGELTQATAAFGALGIQNMGADQFATAMDRMAKSTGRTGMAGFYQTIAEIGKIPDVSQRAQAAMQVFGKSGMMFMPLINAADESVEALQTVCDAMPAVPQSAADAGDAVSDAMGFVAQSIKSIWLQALGTICGWFDNEYKGGVREAALSAGNYLEYYTKVAVAHCIAMFRKFQEYLKRFGDAIGSFIGAKMAGASWSEAFDMAGEAYDQAVKEYEDAAAEIDRIEEQRTNRFAQKFVERKEAIEKFQRAYDKAATSIKKRQIGAGKAADVGRQTKISNDLVYAGSNAALKMQILGPTLQSEAKKQTSILEKIAKNTEKTAENTEESATADDVGVID